LCIKSPNYSVSVTFHTVFQDVRPHPGTCIRPEGLENNNDGRGREICSRRQPIGLPLQQLLGPLGDPHFILAIATFPLLSLLRPMVVATGRVIALLVEGHCYANYPAPRPLPPQHERIKLLEGRRRFPTTIAEVGSARLSSGPWQPS
jgi:hypothetical protein